MDDPNKKGVSVKEIENFTKKYRLEVFFCLSLILACFFSWAFFGTGLSVIFAMIGGLIGVLLSSKIEFMLKKMWHFIFKQEQATQVVLGVVMLVISIFVPPAIFFLLGIGGGKSLYHQALEVKAQHIKE